MTNKYFQHIILIIVFLFIGSSAIHAEDPRRKEIADSLTHLLKNPNIPDSLKVIQISELALMDHNLVPYNQRAFEYTQKAMEIANRLDQTDPKIFIYASRMFLEDNGVKKGVAMDSCEYYIEKSDNPLARSQGWLHMAQAKYHTNESYPYLEKALEEIKGKGLWLQEQAVYYSLTHHFHITVTDYPQIITYAKLALEAALKCKDDYVIAKSYHDLGVAYYINFSRDPQNIELGNLALDNFNKVHDMYEEEVLSKHKRSNQLLYITTLVNLSNIAYVYEYHDVTIECLTEALNLALEYDKNKSIDYSMTPYINHNATLYILQCYSTLSKLHNENNEYSKAEEYLLKALDYLPDNIIDDMRNGTFPAYRFSLDLAKLYVKMGRNKDAAKYYAKGLEQYKENYDYQLQGMRDHLSASYQSQKQDQELEALQESIEIKKNLNYLYIAISVIIILALGLIYYSVHLRLKASKQREEAKVAETKLTEMRKQQIELSAKLKAQESDRLQKELLAGSLLVEHKNRIFENLKQFFANHKELMPYKDEIESVLEEDIHTESDNEDFKTDVQDVHPEFYARLQEKADNKLTSLDLQYCRCIFMKMSSKEMADIMHVDPKTIRVNKYRLKQKLQLTKEEDLNLFIEQII